MNYIVCTVLFISCLKFVMQNSVTYNIINTITNSVIKHRVVTFSQIYSQN